MCWRVVVLVGRMELEVEKEMIEKPAQPHLFEKLADEIGIEVRVAMTHVLVAGGQRQAVRNQLVTISPKRTVEDS